jgi:hypothetical protein
MEEWIVDKPKILFKRFEKLGIYKWENIIKLAKNDVTKDIMAIIFTNTEVFTKSITLKEIQKLHKEYQNGKEFNPITSVKISHDLFLTIYKQGNLL